MFFPADAAVLCDKAAFPRGRDKGNCLLCVSSAKKIMVSNVEWELEQVQTCLGNSMKSAR